MAKKDDWEYCEHCGQIHFPVAPTTVTVKGELLLTPTKKTVKKKSSKKREG